MSSNIITVYITNYNYGKFIKKCVESVLAQSIKNYELIIIDDGSTDDSKEILKEYKEYKNIKIVFQKNIGLNATNNVAIGLSQGKYILRLDADAKNIGLCGYYEKIGFEKVGIKETPLSTNNLYQKSLKI